MHGAFFPGGNEDEWLHFVVGTQMVPGKAPCRAFRLLLNSVVAPLVPYIKKPSFILCGVLSVLPFLPPCISLLLITK